MLRRKKKKKKQEEGNREGGKRHEWEELMGEMALIFELRDRGNVDQAKKGTEKFNSG